MVNELRSNDLTVPLSVFAFERYSALTVSTSATDLHSSDDPRSEPMLCYKFSLRNRLLLQ